MSEHATTWQQGRRRRRYPAIRQSSLRLQKLKKPDRIEYGPCFVGKQVNTHINKRWRPRQSMQTTTSLKIEARRHNTCYLAGCDALLLYQSFLHRKSIHVLWHCYARCICIRVPQQHVHDVVGKLPKCCIAGL